MIEDDRNNHPLFQHSFGTAGFKVLIRPTADGTFVEDVVDCAPDIISMDIMIGKSGAVVERDGIDAATLLQADERTRHIPIIFLTNFYEPNKIAKAKEIGAVDFISLQAHSMQELPKIFLTYLEDPDSYIPTQPLMRS